MKTNPNPKTKAPTKREMLESISQAVAQMEWPWEVRLTSKVMRDLCRPENKTYLESAYRWSTYILTWQYGRLPSDNRDADYSEMLGAIRRMYTDKVLEWKE